MNQLVGDFLSPSEIVGLGCPALPSTERGLLTLIERHNWRGDARRIRPRAGRGGGWEYHLTLLPSETQARYAARKAAALAVEETAAAREALWSRYESLNEGIRNKAEHRLTVMHQLAELQAGGMQTSLAVTLIARRAKLSPATVWNWLKALHGVSRADWLPALAPRHVGRTATEECDPRAWDFLKADYLRPEQPSFTACFRRMAEAAEQHGWAPIPSEKTLSRRLEREVPRGARTLARGGRSVAERIYPHQTRDRSAFAPLEAVNADGHRFDVFCRFEDGEIGRPIMVAVQDLFSGLIVGHRIGRTESWPLVRAGFGDMLESFGVPAAAYLDNGRGFASKMMTGRMKTRFRFKVKADEPEGLLTGLGVKVHWTTPYHGQSKPIERAFRDLCEEIAKHPGCAGAYTGNAPDAKPANYGSKAIAIEAFRGLVAREIARHNNRVGRSSLTARGRSFAETYRAAIEAGAMITRASAAQRRLFLMAAEGLTSRAPTGEVHLANNRYWAEPLVELAGRKLIVRFDPDDLLAPIAIYTLDGRWVCEAPVIEATGFQDIEAARAHAQRRRAWLKLQRECLDLERRMSIKDVARLIRTPDPVEPPPAARVVRMASGGQATAAVLTERAEESFGRAVRAITSENVLPFPGPEAGGL